MGELSTWVLLSIGLVILAVGALDAAFGGEWDLLVVFLLALGVHLVVWVRQQASRVPLTIRSDLAHWLDRQSQRSGEPIDDIVDRAVAWYRSGLFAPTSRPVEADPATTRSSWPAED